MQPRVLACAYAVRSGLRIRCASSGTGVGVPAGASRRRPVPGRMETARLRCVGVRGDRGGRRGRLPRSSVRNSTASRTSCGRSPRSGGTVPSSEPPACARVARARPKRPWAARPALDASTAAAGGADGPRRRVPRPARRARPARPSAVCRAECRRRRSATPSRSSPPPSPSRSAACFPASERARLAPHRKRSDDIGEVARWRLRPSLLPPHQKSRSGSCVRLASCFCQWHAQFN